MNNDLLRLDDAQKGVLEDALLRTAIKSEAIPCSWLIGKQVYTIIPDPTRNPCKKYMVYGTEFRRRMEGEIGKTVFFTRSAAIAARDAMWIYGED